MKKLLAGLCVLMFGFSALGAPAPPLLRTPNTTNITVGLPATIESPIFDLVNNRWDFRAPAIVDRTNIFSAINTFNSDLMAGTTNVTGSIAGKQDLLVNSSGLRGALSDETGSGLAVFATSPTVTTPQVNDTFKTEWLSVTPNWTNAVIDLAASVNHYYTLSTSNYVIFSNLVAGAQGAVLIHANGTPQEVNWSSSYDNWSTNEIAPVFTVTNRAWIAYQVTFGTDATNVALALKRK